MRRRRSNPDPPVRPRPSIGRGGSGVGAGPSPHIPSPTVSWTNGSRGGCRTMLRSGQRTRSSTVRKPTRVTEPECPPELPAKFCAGPSGGSTTWLGFPAYHTANLRPRLRRPDPTPDRGRGGGDGCRTLAVRHPHEGKHGHSPLGPPTATGVLKIRRFSDGRWAQSDLNRRPPGYQPGAPAKLSYGPLAAGKSSRLYVLRGRTDGWSVDSSPRPRRASPRKLPARMAALRGR